MSKPRVRNSVPRGNGAKAAPPVAGNQVVHVPASSIPTPVAQAQIPRGLSTRDKIAALSELLGRERFMARLGMQYGSKRDIYAVAGYPKSLTFDDYWALYERGDVAGRIVDMMPQTTWREAPEVVDPQEDGSQDDTDFTTAFKALAKRLRVWNILERADRLCGVGRYSVILIGVRGDAEDADLKNELPTVKSPDDVLYFQVYHEGAASIVEFETNTKDPRFGLPKTYQIDFSVSAPTSTAGKDQKGIALQVHHSRIIHVAEDKLVDNVYGRPRLKRVYNRLMDIEKIAASTGESFWQLASRILSASTQNGAVLEGPDEKKLREDLEEIVHDLRRVFVGQNMDLKWLESQPPDPSQAVDVLLSLIAGATGYPKRILFGSETGERASEQDQKHWFGIVRERQTHFAEPEILRALVDRLISCGALPEPDSEDGYEVVWPELYQMTEDEQAAANLKRAQIASGLTPVGGDPMELVEIDEERNVWLVPTPEGWPPEGRFEEPEPPPLPPVNPLIPSNPDGTIEGPDGQPVPPGGQGNPPPPPPQPSPGAKPKGKGKAKKGDAPETVAGDDVTGE